MLSSALSPRRTLKSGREIIKTLQNELQMKSDENVDDIKVDKAKHLNTDLNIASKRQLPLIKISGNARQIGRSKGTNLTN